MDNMLKSLLKLRSSQMRHVEQKHLSPSAASATLLLLLLSRVRLFATLWTAARQASLSVSNSQSLLKLMSIESVVPPNHLILRRPLLLLPSVCPSIRVFCNGSALRIRWPEYWSFSVSISPSTLLSADCMTFRVTCW